MGAVSVDKNDPIVSPVILKDNQKTAKDSLSLPMIHLSMTRGSLGLAKEEKITLAMGIWR